MSYSPDILIVDDTPDNIRFLSSLLQDQGYKVRKAINGKMALTAVQAALPDLILLDINMPGMTGYEVCEYLKQDAQTRSVPVIFLSALDDVEDKVKAFQVGGADYITKPFQFEEVLVRICNQLTIQRLQGELRSQNGQLEETLSELKKTQAQLIQKEKMLSLGQLAAGMAHEINNPINFISANLKFVNQYIKDLQGVINLYQKEYPNPAAYIQEELQAIDIEFVMSDLQKITGSMQVGVDRIHAIVLALRIFSRLGESDLKPVNIHEGIDSTLILLQSRLEPSEKRGEIKIIKNYGNFPAVTCYASQINQVFINLLNNAIDALEFGTGKEFPPPTEPTIWIGTELTKSTTLIVRIKDNGAGISEKVKSRLFDPFFTTKSVGKGSGLGLSTSYQIVVEKHKGQLTCESSPGRGAEFTIEIPVNCSNSLNEED